MSPTWATLPPPPDPATVTDPDQRAEVLRIQERVAALEARGT